MRTSFEEATLNQVISDDALCIQSQKLGLFNFRGGVERISFFTGDGNAIQSGGYSTNSFSSTQFGVDLSNQIYGTHNNFGVPYEILLNVKPLD